MRLSDEEGFRAFFRAEIGGVVNRVAIVTGDRPSAEDAAQEAFVKLYGKWRTVSGYENPQAWVRKVALRIALRALGRTARSLPSPPERVLTDGSDQRLDVQAAIATLSPNQRAAVILYYFEDLPVADISNVLGCAVSTVKVHLHRARAALATALHEEANDVIG